MFDRCPPAMLGLSLLVAFGAGAPLQSATAGDAGVDAWLDQNLPPLIALYRELHQAPELSHHEEQTAARMARELAALGINVTSDIGGHGLVGILENGPGPKLMLRADMDALPVEEETQLVYSSRVRTANEEGVEVGVMHACGHDIHMTNLIGAARYLSAHRDRWSGTIMFLLQPAEERGAGAKAMLDDRLFERFFKPDFSLALHVDSALPAGKVACRAGYTLANVDSVDIFVRGRGGHGAFPHTTIDPIVIAARLILDLQTIVSRETPPTEPAVITVGSIHAGSKHNVISDECHLQITVRSYSDAVRKQLLDAIRRKAAAAAASAAAPEPEITVSEGTPAMYNDDELVARIAPVFRRTLGDDNVADAEPAMGGEDYSQFGLAGVPIMMFRLGAVEEQRLAGYARVGQTPPSLHSALFYPDAEPTLRTGLRATAAALFELLPPAPQEPENAAAP